MCHRCDVQNFLKILYHRSVLPSLSRRNTCIYFQKNLSRFVNKSSDYCEEVIRYFLKSGFINFLWSFGRSLIYTRYLHANYRKRLCNIHEPEVPDSPCRPVCQDRTRSRILLRKNRRWYLITISIEIISRSRYDVASLSHAQLKIFFFFFCDVKIRETETYTERIFEGNSL